MDIAGMARRLSVPLLSVFLTGPVFVQSAPAAATPPFASAAALGEALFSDTNLSMNRTEACATCHNPDVAFTDPRKTRAGRAVSLGDDGLSLGDRNAPTVTYALFSPEFRKDADGNYVGGQFLDGRRPGLEGQAGDPPLNPIEMAMPGKAAVVDRLRENPQYVAAFQRLWGDDMGDVDAAYAHMTEAIAAFERTKVFDPFDSKYDRYLRGEVKLTDQEELGRVLFFSQQFTNCNLCHQLRTTDDLASDETFTNYQYRKIGVPKNMAARQANGSAPDFVDHGLLENPAANDPDADGKFKVPTLRNVAVTAPYMHNGVFKHLRTVVLFYNKYNSRSPKRQINPETGKPWGPPEVPGTVDLKDLQHGPALKDNRIDALVAFLKTLTDARYEHLLNQD